MAGTSPAKTRGDEGLMRRSTQTARPRLTLTADNFEKHAAHLGLGLLDPRLE